MISAYDFWAAPLWLPCLVVVEDNLPFQAADLREKLRVALRWALDFEFPGDLTQHVTLHGIDWAADAVALFSYQAKKWIGSFAAALGGLDTLVFAGGIGENNPAIRTRIGEGLEFLGIDLDKTRNAENAAVISAPSGRVTVRVIRTDEELLIAHSACRVLGLGAVNKED